MANGTIVSRICRGKAPAHPFATTHVERVELRGTGSKPGILLSARGQIVPDAGARQSDGVRLPAAQLVMCKKQRAGKRVSSGGGS